MAETRYANLQIDAEVLKDYISEQSIYSSSFYQSGVITRLNTLDSFLDGNGKTVAIPSWDSIVGGAASEIPSETSDQTVNNIDTSKQVAQRQLRVNAWGSNDLAAAFNGNDPMNAIGTQVVDYWNVEKQDLLIASINGVLADNVANDSSDLVNDISAGTGDAAKISSDAVIDTKFLLGDKQQVFTTIAMHSVPYNRLCKLNLIDFTPTNVQNIGFGTYLGMTVIVNDKMPVDTGDYTSVLFKAGAFGYGESNSGISPLEMYRNPKAGAGIDELYSRTQFAMHPLGFSWAAGSVANAQGIPTAAELALAANWDRVFDKKNCGFCALITKE